MNVRVLLLFHDFYSKKTNNPAMGELIINFLGPPPNEFLTRKVCLLISVVFFISLFEQAIDVLGTYLTSSAVAPLNKEFVEIESPLW